MDKEQDARVCAIIEAGEKLLLAARTAYPAASDSSILTVCQTAVNMALEKAAEEE